MNINNWTQHDIDLLKHVYETQQCSRGNPRTYPKELLDRHSRSRCIKKASALGFSSVRAQPTFTKDICPNDLSYMAGFFDADGSLYIVQRPIFKLSNSDLAVLEWAQEIVGAGRITPKSWADSHTKQHYDYIVARTNDLYKLLVQLYPFVKMKQGKIDLALAWLCNHFDHLDMP